MDTTTIRVDSETHRQLRAFSAASGESLIETVRQATHALARRRFADRVTTELAALRSDPEAWAAYLDDADATSVTDGLG